MEYSYITLIAFLLLNLGVGLYYGRHVKTFRDYALGKENISTILLGITIAATWLTGSGFSIYLNEVFKESLWTIIIVFFATLSLLFVGRLALRTSEFYGSFSVAEVLGRLYGRWVRTIAAIASILMCIASLAGQLRAVTAPLATILEVNANYLLLITASVVVSYSFFGGMRSVISTDLLQFLAMGLCLPLLLISLYTIAQPDLVSFWTNSDQLSLNTLWSGGGNYANMLGIIEVYFIGLMPPLFHRLLLKRNVFKTQAAFRIAAFGFAYVIANVIMLGLFFAAAHQGLKTDNLLIFAAQHYNYPIIKALLALIISAMAISSADSYMSTGAVIFANDIARPLRGDQGLLQIGKLFTLFIGISSVALALVGHSLLGLIFLGSAIYLPVVVVPLVLALQALEAVAR